MGMTVFEATTACGAASFVMALWDRECWNTWMALGLFFLGGQWAMLLF